MPANWAPLQKLSNGRVEWPTGPMTGLHPNFEPTWVEAWVVQSTTGANPADKILTGPSQSTAQSSWTGFTPNQWTAAEPGWKSGVFYAGPALGISLLAMRNKTTGDHEFDWWFQPITLF